MSEARVAVIGGGPIGLEVAANLRRQDIPYVHFEAEAVGATVMRWPAGARFLAAPERAAIADVPAQTVRQEALTRDEYLAYLRTVVETLGLDVRTHSPVRSLEQIEGGWLVEVEDLWRQRTSLEVEEVIVATGNMSRRRKPKVRGLQQEHVHQGLREIQTYFRRRVLVVGDGNSAIEAALRLFRSGAEVHVSIPGERLDPEQVKPDTIEEFEMLVEKGAIRCTRQERVQEIDRRRVRCDPQTGPSRWVETDFVVFEIGWEPDRTMLRSVGARFDAEGRLSYDARSMRVNGGVFVAGTAVEVGGDGHEAFIATTHDHVEKILAELGVWDAKTGDVEHRAYSFDKGDNE